MSTGPDQMTGKNRIMIFGPKDDRTYVVEFMTAEGDVLAISIPRTEAHVIRHFQERIRGASRIRAHGIRQPLNTRPDLGRVGPSSRTSCRQKMPRLRASSRPRSSPQRRKSSIRRYGHAALRDLSAVADFFACFNCASSSPLRTAVIKMSMTKEILLSDGTAIPFLPFSNSIGFPPHRTNRT